MTIGSTPGATLGDEKIQEFISPFHLPAEKKIPFEPLKRKVIVIGGPTAVGKTAISLQIAHAIGGEIISADSMQIYREMDIGTAKLKLSEQQSIRHHLIDSRDIDEPFNVVDFYHETGQAFREIFARDHIPIVVGGTGFYIHALLYGPPQGPPSVPEVRRLLEKEMEEKGPLVLFERLKMADPIYAATITARDRHKIIRALEIIELTHKKVSSFVRESTPSKELNFRCWFLYKPKEVLYKTLDKRCDRMLTEGFLDEVKKLEKKGLRNNLTASKAIGYRQCLQYLDSPQTADDWNFFVQKFKQAARNYAKRQFTWGRSEPLFRSLDVDQLGPETTIEMIIQDYERSE